MKKYIIFGAGSYGRKALNMIGHQNVEFFCDNSQQAEVDGIAVIDIARLREIYQDYMIVVAVKSVKSNVEICLQLQKNNIPFVLLEDVVKCFVEKERNVYQRMNKRPTFNIDESFLYYMPFDKYESAGNLGSYFWQDLWAARRIYENKPAKHYDIGSRMDGFILALSAFHLPVHQIDIRPMKHTIPDVDFFQDDATELKQLKNNSIESMSALCSLEHFGLGRYGDPIDPESCFKCFKSIQKKVKVGGHLYLSVPVGWEHLEFNAHRVFYASTIKEIFSEMKLLEYSSVYGDAFEYNIDLHKYDSWKCKGGGRFGLFLFQKG